LIYDNYISLNKASGIFIEESTYNYIEKNVFLNNSIAGVYLFGSTHNNIKKNNFYYNSKNGYFEFFNRYQGKPLAFMLRLELIRTRNYWNGNFWEKPQSSPYKIEGSLGDWYHLYPDGGYGGKVTSYYMDRHPAQEPYDIPGIR
jgi:parallel beta-helix repeat protein